MIECRVNTQRKSMDYFWFSKYDIMETMDDAFFNIRKNCPVDLSIRIILTEKYYEMEIRRAFRNDHRYKMVLAVELKHKADDENLIKT